MGFAIFEFIITKRYNCKVLKFNLTQFFIQIFFLPIFFIFFLTPVNADSVCDIKATSPNGGESWKVGEEFDLWHGDFQDIDDEIEQQESAWHKKMEHFAPIRNHLAGFLCNGLWSFPEREAWIIQSLPKPDCHVSCVYRHTGWLPCRWCLFYYLNNSWKVWYNLVYLADRKFWKISCVWPTNKIRAWDSKPFWQERAFSADRLLSSLDEEVHNDFYHLWRFKWQP